MNHPTLLNLDTMSRRLVPLVYTLLLAAAFLAPAARAETVDDVVRAKVVGKRVYDFANVLSDADERRIQQQLSAIEKSGKAQGLVTIVDRIEGADRREFALDLMTRLGVGSRETENGFVLLIAIGERKARLETGNGLETVLPDSVVSRIGREAMAPRLRKNDYSGAIEAALTDVTTAVEGAGGAEALPVRPVTPESRPAVAWFILLGWATAVAAAFTFPRGGTAKTDPSRLVAILLGIATLAAALIAAAGAPQFTALYLVLAGPPVFFAAFRLLENSWSPARMEDLPALRSKAVSYFWVGAAVLLLGGLVFLRRAEALVLLLTAVPLGLLLPGYFQRMPRKCLECGGELRWLHEKDEPARLHQEEDLEQRLGSMEYDVWHCERCDRSAVIARARIFAGYGECPKCHRRTLRTRTEMTDAPTAYADGWANDITECVNPRCGHTDIKRKSVDRRGGGFGWDGGPGIIILPGGWGGGWGGGGGASHGDSGGWGGGGGGFDVGDFGGGGGGGGGADIDW